MATSAKKVFRKFLKEFEKSKVDWEKIYNKNREWTRHMIGNNRSREKGDFGILGAIGKREGYKIQAEWMHFDQAWYYTYRDTKISGIKPWRTDVVIEHENDHRYIPYCCIKLAESKAPLKILIAYPGKKKKRYIEEIKHIVSKRRQGDEKYLVIFGQLADKKVVWEGICL
jgi:hypothetical protein